MTTQIRPMERADIPRVLPLLRAVHPCRVLTGEAMRWRAENPLPGMRETTLLAVEDGAPVGFLRSALRRDGEGPRSGRSLLATVAASHRDTDVGARLLDASERHLVEGGAEVLRTEAAEEDVQAGGEAFRRTVLERGYTPEDTNVVLGLDLAALTDPPRAPEGVELRPFGDYADDPREIYRVAAPAPRTGPVPVGPGRGRAGRHHLLRQRRGDPDGVVHDRHPARVPGARPGRVRQGSGTAPGT